MFVFPKYVDKELTQSRRHVHLNLGGKVFTGKEPKDYQFGCLSLSTKSVSHSIVFFSYNKSANSTFSHGFSDRQTDL